MLATVDYKPHVPLITDSQSHPYLLLHIHICLCIKIAVGMITHFPFLLDLTITALFSFTRFLSLIHPCLIFTYRIFATSSIFLLTVLHLWRKASGEESFHCEWLARHASGYNRVIAMVICVVGCWRRFWTLASWSRTPWRPTRQTKSAALYLEYIYVYYSNLKSLLY